MFRIFGKQVCLGIAVLVASVSVKVTTHAASPPTPPSAHDFAMKKTVSLLELGPEGQQAALLSRTYAKICRSDRWEREPLDKCKPDEQKLAATDKVLIVDLKTKKPVNAISIPDDVTVNWMEWTSPNNLLVSITTGWKIGRRSYTPPTGRILSVKTDGSAPMVMLFGDEERLLRDNRRLSRTVDLLHDDPHHVIMGAWRNGDYDLFRVNVDDGDAVRVAKGRALTIAWYTNRDGVPSVRLDCTSRSCRKIKLHRPADGADPNDEETDWINVRTFKQTRRGKEDVLEIDWVAPTDVDDEYYVMVEGEGEERRSIKIYNIRTDTFVRDVFSDPVYDVNWPLINSETGNYAGAAVWKDRLTYHLLDTDLQKHLNAINAFFEDRWNITMTGFSDNGQVAVVKASAPNDPGSYYLYDFTTHNVVPLTNTHTSLPGEFNSRTQVVSVTTRDGQSISAYHTVPSPDRVRGGIAPLIVLVHGGPEVRDYFDYDRDVQFLASRGFQVLQVNFRGSSGYGRSFAEAGHRQWTGIMHNDVMDATRQLVADGHATPATTCIMGHSYGGFAALYAGAMQANEFACVIAGAGVSDLYESLKQDRKKYGYDSTTFEYWSKSIGDMKTERDQLRASSPVNLADRFDDPVLLIHGENDGIVDFSHSEDMKKALEKAGKTVGFLELDEGHYHNRWSIECSTEYFERLESFLETVFPVATDGSVQAVSP
ncbi:prolyl oligopeptidase [Algimonas arctica]|uniref:Prolyl oligopeptidase n=2 Tax=Algimonas arctica TaxID=1479486 RepID=A0A8J3CSH0_9PROT|nr:prolyl oligopeptidase [Algimonas arctica]